MQPLSVVFTFSLLSIALVATARDSLSPSLEAFPVPGTRIAHRHGAVLPPRTALTHARIATPAGDDNGVELGVTDNEETYGELRQQVVALAGGGFASTWREGEWAASAVRLQFVRPDGATVFPDGGLVVAPDSSGPDIVLAAHATSGAIVAYEHNANAGSNEVRVQWIDADGNRRWTPDGVAAFGVAQSNRVFSELNVVASPDGGAFVCAQRSVFQFDTPIVCQRIDAAGGRSWTTGGVALGGTPGWRVLPKGIVDGNGGLFVFWQNDRMHDDASIDPILIEGQHIGPTGTLLWGAGGVLAHTTVMQEQGYHIYPQFNAVSDGVGGVVVAFEDWNGAAPPTRDVFAQRIAADGSLPWGAAVGVAVGSQAQQLDSLIGAGDGGALVSAVSFLSEDRCTIRIYRVGAGGAPRWGVGGKPLSDPSAVACDFGSYGHVEANRLRIAWTSQKQPATWTFDIFAAEYTLSGHRLVGPEGVQVYIGNSENFLRGFAHDTARGTSLVVFEDYFPDTTQRNTMGALYRPDGLFRDTFE